MSLTPWAALNAERLLSPLGARWDHVQQVPEQARRIAETVPLADRDLLVASAYLHDVGYAPELARLAFIRWMALGGSGITGQEADSLA